MIEPVNSGVPSSPWLATGGGMRETLRMHREQLRAYAAVPPTEEETQLSSVSVPPAALSIDELAPDVEALVARYRRYRPGVRITPVRYLTVGGDEAMATAGTTDLPPDERFVGFIITETVFDSEQVEVFSRILIAEQRSVDAD